MLTINLQWDSNALAAPQSFRTGVQAATNILEAAILNPITVNIAVGYGEYGLNTPDYLPLGSNISVGGIETSIPVQYPALKALLGANETSASGAAAVGLLPNTTSLGGVTNFGISTALAKAFGVLPANAPATDGYIGVPTSFSGSVLIGAAIVEEVHALGLLQGQFGDLGLFSYTGPGNHFTGYGNAAYLSLDGGKTDLGNYDVGFDDTLFTGLTNDAFDVPIQTSNTLSPLDLAELGAIGFDDTSTPVTPAPSITPAATQPGTTAAVVARAFSVPQSVAVSALSLVASVSAPAGDVITYYGFDDNRGDGGHFAIGGVVEPTNSWFYVLNTQLGALQYVGGTSAGSETLSVDGFDATAGRFTPISTAVATTTSPAAIISGYFQTILGRSADAGSLAGLVSAVNTGASYAQIQAALANSAEAQNDIAGVYQAELGRPGDAAAIASATQSLATGGSLAGLRAGVAASAEAQNDIYGVYQAELGRAADASGDIAATLALAAGGSLATVRANTAASAEAQNDISGIYQAELGRPADTAGAASITRYLASGGSLPGARGIIASSGEAQGDIATVYQAELGRPVDAAAAASVTQFLANGGSIASVRSGVASSGEAQNAISAIYQAELGRPADTVGLAAFTRSLAAGGSLAGIAGTIAASAEAQTAINGLYQAELGRPADTVGLAYFTGSLAAGGSLAGIAGVLAGSAEAQTDLAGIYQAELGRPADAAGVAAFTRALAGGGSLAGVQATIAGSTEAQAAVTNLLQTDTGSAPAASAVTAGQTQLTDGLSLADLNAQTINLASTPTMFLALGGGTTNVTGPGAAVFGFRPGFFGPNVIIGFDPAKDVLQLNQAQFPTLAAVQADLSQTAGGAVITLDPVDRITLQGIPTTSLVNADCRFV